MAGGPMFERGVRAIRRLRLMLIVAVSLLLIVSAWLPGAGAPYQYDDYITPVKDPASESLTSWLRSVPGTLRPLTKLTYAAESSAGLRDAPARRGLNALIFVLSAGLLALLARGAGLGVEAAAALATLWACHPVHAELVIALAGRSVLLALFLMLLSAVLLLRERAGAAIACATLAVLARETAWPWLVVCASVSSWGRGRARVLGALAVATVLGGVLVFSSRLQQLLLFSWSDASAWNRLGLQWAALPRGLLMWLFEPAAFAVDIEFSPAGWLRLSYLLGAFAMYGAAAWVAFRPQHSRALRVSALLWLCLVVPLHSVVPKLDALTARDMSASSAALVSLSALPLARIFAGSRFARLAVWAALSAVLLVLVPLARQRAKLYQEPIALWADAAARSRHSTRPLINLGTLLAQNGRLAEARATLQEAVRRSPRGLEARERLAAVEVLIETRKLLTGSDQP